MLNYNGYSYCLNNPLKYTDPSGYNREMILREWDREQRDDPGYDQLYNNYVDYWGQIQDAFANMHTYEESEKGKEKKKKEQEPEYILINVPGIPFPVLIPKNFKPVKNADGIVISASFDFAFMGGAGFELGLVIDNFGNKQFFSSWNVNIGYGIAAVTNVRNIYSKPGSIFHASDYLGYSAGFSGGVYDIGGTYGGYKDQWEYNGFLNFGGKYIEKGFGANLVSGSKGPMFGIWWYNAKVNPLFGR